MPCKFCGAVTEGESLICAYHLTPEGRKEAAEKELAEHAEDELKDKEQNSAEGEGKKFYSTGGSDVMSEEKWQEELKSREKDPNWFRGNAKK